MCGLVQYIGNDMKKSAKEVSSNDERCGRHPLGKEKEGEK
jgi:hypothetical protein